MNVFPALGTRSIAFLADFLCVGAAWIGLAMLGENHAVSIPGWSFVAFAAIYFGAMTMSPWQATLGKKLVKIKVTDLAGHRIGAGRSLVRFAGTCVTFATGGLGLVIAAWTPRRRALEDLVAGTVVVDAKASAEAIAVAIAPPIPWSQRILGIAGVAFVMFAVSAMTSMYDAVIIRDKTRDMLEGATAFRSEVTDALNEQRAIPVPAKLPPHARALTAAVDGIITLETANDFFPNGRYIFKPVMKDGRVASWDCRTENIATSYLPATCR